MAIKLDGIKHNIETRYKLDGMAIHKYWLTINLNSLISLTQTLYNSFQ